MEAILYQGFLSERATEVGPAGTRDGGTRRVAIGRWGR